MAIGQNLDLTVALPWIEIGAPQWDSIPIEFHNLFGLPQGPHEDVPSAQTLVWIAGRTTSLLRGGEIEGSGIGDLLVVLGGRAGRFLGADHRWYAAAEAPTGSEGTIRGSGGWDLGLRWSATWQPGRSAIRAGAGFTYLDPNGSWLGLERNNLWHLYLAAEVPVGKTFAVVGSLRYERSPIADQIGGELGDPGLLITFGAAARLGSGLQGALLMDEGVPPLGVAPDVGFRFVLGMTIPTKEN